MNMALFSNGKGKKIIGRSLVAYRLQNSKAIDSKTAAEVIANYSPESVYLTTCHPSSGDLFLGASIGRQRYFVNLLQLIANNSPGLGNV